jgi:hypothetical protein
VLPPQWQGPPCSDRRCWPNGAHWLAEDGPNKATVGTPSPAAKCKGPVSRLTNTRARLTTARKAARSGLGIRQRASGTSRVKSSSSDFSRGVKAESFNLAVAGHRVRRNQVVLRQVLTHRPRLIILHVNNLHEFDDEREKARFFLAGPILQTT